MRGAASALANLMLNLAIPLAHLAFLTGEPADGAVSEETLIARIREQFGFLGAGVTVVIRDGIAHISRPAAAAAKADEATKLYERAGKRARDGDFARAAELYARVLKLNPALPAAHRDLAMSLVELQRTEEAKDALIDALRLKPDDAWSLVVLGNIYIQRPDGPARARQFFARALELKPVDAWALNGLATALARTGDTAGALARYDEAIVAQPRQMLRQRRLAEPNLRYQGVHRHLAVREQIAEHEKPMLVGERLQEARGFLRVRLKLRHRQDGLG